MLNQERIKEAESNVKRYLEEGLLKMQSNDTAKMMYLENCGSSIQTAQKIIGMKSREYDPSLWVIVTSYYAMSQKADSLLQSLDYEREKRSKFQYQTDEQAKHSKAITSLERAKEFVFEMKKLL
ncbi:hypothetical protein HYX12_01165 [Candidatus Woesearchaeota archaeon]|nr:hypothetical protein [Candidatus Woesearchaeota archaeon]